LGSGETCTTIPESCTISHQISALFKSLYPRKTWSVVAGFLGLSERTAKYRMSASRPYTVDELQTILQGEDGFDFLQMLMGKAQPRWWWWAQRVIAIARRRRQAAEIDQEILRLETSPLAGVGSSRRIKSDIHASQNIGAKFARAETALGIFPQDVGRGGIGSMVEAEGKTQARAGARRG
jgi:hypothetical protein